MTDRMTVGKTPRQKAASPAKARTNLPKKSASARRVAAKPAPKRPTKPASTPTIKVVAKAPAAKAGVQLFAKGMAKAPGKAGAKPTSKPTKIQPPAKKGKPKKAKMVRDSFTMPALEYELIAAVKRRCVANGMAVKKSEVLRAAIVGFAALSDSVVAKAIQDLPVIKTGRPAKGQK